MTGFPAGREVDPQAEADRLGAGRAERDDGQVLLCDEIHQVAGETGDPVLARIRVTMLRVFPAARAQPVPVPAGLGARLAEVVREELAAALAGEEAA